MKNIPKLHTVSHNLHEIEMVSDREEEPTTVVYSYSDPIAFSSPMSAGFIVRDCSDLSLTTQKHARNYEEQERWQKEREFKLFFAGLTKQL